jgi:uncharacterized membrane-anchored protein
MNQLAIDWELVVIVTLTVSCELLHVFQLKKDKRKAELIWTIIICGAFIATTQIDSDKHPLRLAMLITVMVLLFFRWYLHRKKNRTESLEPQSQP